MRPLTEDEMRVLFQKLSEYIGRNIEHLLTSTTTPHSFRYLREKIYYIPALLLKTSTQIPSDNILSLGTCLGKFTKGGKFKLHITALEIISKYALYKVWIKPSSEMSFLYGNNVQKSGLGKISENVPQYGGVVVYSMSDMPLGFGIAGQKTEVMKDLETGANVVLHQGDVGEYLRVEDEMF